MNCRVCHSQNLKPHIFQERMFGTHEEFQYFECFDCGLMQIANIPADMSKYYGSNYYSVGVIDDEFAKKKRFTRKTDQIKRALERKTFKMENDASIFCSLNPSYESSILDVGCGAGEFLYRLKEIGFKNLLGVDPFIAEDIYYKNGLKILKQEVSQVQSKFDFIVLNHSLEHMPDPSSVLNYLKALLNPNGKILIRVPMLGYSWHVYKGHFFGLDVPRHFYIFTEQSMAKMIDKCGLKLDKVVYDSVWDYLAQSEKYLSGKDYSARFYDGFWGRIKYYWPKFKYKMITNEMNAKGFSDQAGFVISLPSE
jgi:SAM-dependent methyltransferase